MKTKKGYSIIELLVVMSIIVLMISLLVPALSAVRRFSKVVVQRNQFKDIAQGLELYKNEYSDEYPDSNAIDLNGELYCGAMILGEVLRGQDGMGLHVDSRLTNSDTVDLVELYLPAPGTPTYSVAYRQNLMQRVKFGEEIDFDYFGQIYADTGSFPASVDPNTSGPTPVVIYDIFRNVDNFVTGEDIGMPVLYYKADVRKLSHNTADPTDTDNIYDYTDNHQLVRLGLPDNSTFVHPLFQVGTDPEGQVFYQDIEDKTPAAITRPHKPDSYILISAGWDGIYGSKDDVYNF